MKKREKKSLLYKSIKIKIFPTPEQEEILLTISRLCTELWNAALFQRNIWYWQRRRHTNWYEQKKELPELKNFFPEFTGPYSATLVEILNTLEAGYKSFYNLIKKDHKARPPGNKSSRFFCTFQYLQVGFKIEARILKLSHKVSPAPLNFELEEKALEILKYKDIRTVTIFRQDANLDLPGQYYVTITYAMEKPAKQEIKNPKIAIIHLAAHQQTILYYDGQNFELIELKNWRPDEFWSPKLRSIISRMDKCKKGSRRWHKLYALKRKLQQKQKRQLKNFQHKRSREIIDSADVIVTTKFNVKKMVEAKKTDHKGIKKAHKTVFNTALIARVFTYLQYKAALEGKEFILVPSKDISRKCAQCNKILPNSNGNNKCSCGWNKPKNTNACLNIARKYFKDNSPETLPIFDTKLENF